ncbi:MAG: hypothetical protein ACREA4_08505 [Nitrososphaera sp.]
MNRSVLGWLAVYVWLFVDVTPSGAASVEYAEVKTLSLQKYLHTRPDWHVTAYVDVRAGNDQAINDACVDTQERRLGHEIHRW